MAAFKECRLCQAVWVSATICLLAVAASLLVNHLQFLAFLILTAAVWLALFSLKRKRHHLRRLSKGL